MKKKNADSSRKTGGIIGITYHVDDHLSKRLPLFLVQIAEDVAIGILQ